MSPWTSARPWIRLAPGAEGLAELADPRPLLGAPDPGATAAAGLAGELLRTRPGEEVRRLVLRRVGRVHLHRYRGGGRELWRARFTEPRSGSLAERAWNVLCRLAAHGVGVPDLLAVGAAGRGLVAAHSFLVVHPPKLGETLAGWRAGGPTEAEREAGERALAFAIARVAEAGVALPRAEPDTVWLTPNARGHDCGPGESGAEPLPGVVFTDVACARQAAPEAVRAELVRRLGATELAGVPS